MDLPTDPKGAAGKLKPQLQLIPPVFNTETAKALVNGNNKYGPWNWRATKVEIMTYLGAMKRHIDAVLNREDQDPESGADHLGHVAACCAIVLDAREQGTLIDNRPVKGTPEWYPAGTGGASISIGPGAVRVADQVMPLVRGQAFPVPPPFKRPVDSMELQTVMAYVKAKTVLTTNQITAVEQALEPVFEPTGT